MGPGGSAIFSTVQEAYTEAGLTPPVFSETPLVGAVIKALHINELRNAVVSLELR